MGDAVKLMSEAISAIHLILFILIGHGESGGDDKEDTQLVEDAHDSLQDVE